MIILEKIVLWLRLWSYQMIILCCGCSCGLFLEKNWVVVGVVVSNCTKIGLMLLLGCVIQSNCGCGCGCGCSLQVDCVVVVVVVDHFSFCTSLIQIQIHSLMIILRLIHQEIFAFLFVILYAFLAFSSTFLSSE